ncbi:PQQ-dependent sugar dehydrogenase [Psychroflexus planctonicus]|uniref:Glucose/Sorbosone dehydrogenase domain-containing protein n=1 Tax=Psychroflexus planctonicus TaxID=1526575 RepID=A0ABQ1SKK9_9FLAO|nr:PQQ-dependent sugar dehydrogenase [Psychroflexus planctonicus]GGE43983.1 hypothetical protein GCM10010832_25010 [Psychroflexus planctonicus]
MRTLYLSLPIFLFTFFACAQKDEEIIDVEEDYEYEIVTDQLEIAWGIDFFEDGSFLATEKEGNLYYHKNGELKEIGNVPAILLKGQGGLMDVKIHPDFKNNQFIYLSFADEGENDGEGNTKIIRAKFDGNQLKNITEIYKAEPNTSKPYHFGSRIEFDDEGYLYFSVGDRGNRDVNPQSIERDGGKIYRLHDDGSIPTDNPFVNESGAKKAVFSYGHRNPQGMEKNPMTGKIWVHEHGPKGGDEINIIEAGKNYGWPVISYGINYDGTSFTDETSKPGMEQPIHYWVPSIAPSGMTFVTSDKYPELKGNLLVGSLKFLYLEHCVLEGNTVVKRERLLKNSGRLRSVKQSPDGYIYAGIEGVGIVKILPKS